jgi:hypothetical protein
MKEQRKETRSTDLQRSDNSPLKESTHSPPISVNLATHLFELSKKVTATEVNPQTVRAACECAAEIHKLLDLQWRIRR